MNDEWIICPKSQYPYLKILNLEKSFSAVVLKILSLKQIKRTKKVLISAKNKNKTSNFPERASQKEIIMKKKVV